MKRNKVLLTLLLYTAVFLVCTLVFILLFHSPLLKGLDVFLYKGIAFLILCSILAFVLVMAAGHKFPGLGLSVKDGLMTVSLFFGITLSWFVLAPTTVERSISVFMLSYMDENGSGNGITEEEFGDIFYDKYIQDFGAFEKRFHEQAVSGNVEPAADGEGYVITERGRFFVRMFRLCAKMFRTEPWLVYPNEY